MSCKSAILVAVVLFSLDAVGQSAPGDVRLLFTGDILLSRQVKAELQQRNISPWPGFSDLFHSAAFVGGNFEGALGEDSECLASKSPCFAAPKSSARLLGDAGFRAVTVENNHSGDLGRAGRDATRAEFSQSGILALDFEASPQFLRFDNVTVALVSITTVRAADGQLQEIPSIAVAQKLRLARQLANLVVVSIHWGAELLDWSTDLQQAQAQWLVAHGADLIVGHHPHVIQRPQCIGGKPVFFSLGNHLFDQKYLETKEGLIADCHIHAGRLHCGAIRTHTNAATAIPALAGRDRESDQLLEACSPPLHDGLEVGGFEIKPEPWSADRSPLGFILDGFREGKVQWQSRRQMIISLQTAVGIGNEPLVFSLERHSSPLDNEEGLRPYVYAVGPHGFIARWRGSALAWPLTDAVMGERGELCVLHRGDSFVAPNPGTKETRIAAYAWNGFGFKGIETPAQCERLFQ